MNNRYWLATITKLNEHVEKLGLDDLQVIRKTEKDGQEFIEVREAVIPPSFDSHRSRGYGVIQDGEFKVSNLMHLEEKTRAFLDGAKYILDFYRFRENGNFEKFKGLANDFDSIFRNYEIPNRHEVNNFLWDNLSLTRILSQAAYRLRKKFGDELKKELSVASVTSVNQKHPLEGKRIISVNLPLEDTEENTRLLEEFRTEWWDSNVEKVKDTLLLFHVVNRVDNRAAA